MNEYKAIQLHDEELLERIEALEMKLEKMIDIIDKINDASLRLSIIVSKHLKGNK